MKLFGNYFSSYIPEWPKLYAEIHKYMLDCKVYQFKNLYRSLSQPTLIYDHDMTHTHTHTM